MFSSCSGENVTRFFLQLQIRLFMSLRLACPQWNYCAAAELVFLITAVACFLKIMITPLCFMKDPSSRSFIKDAIENDT